MSLTMGRLKRGPRVVGTLLSAQLSVLQCSFIVDAGDWKSLNGPMTMALTKN